jgi:DNA-binding MarR family transcriptional regulator
MDKIDVRTLEFLEEIDNDQTPSQRDLSRKLDVSLGLVNSFIRKLVHKGYLKITTDPENRVKYILTPKGATEKTRLTYQYIQHFFTFYKKTREKLKRLFKELMAQGVRCVVFYGVSDFAEIAYISLQETSIQMVEIVDDNKIGEIFLGVVVKKPTILDLLSFDRIFITLMNKEDGILEKLLKKGIARNKIVMLE